MDKAMRLRLIALNGLLLSIILVGLLVASFYRETSRLTTVVLPPEITACERDADCGVTNMIGCCPCQAGGGQGAVAKEKRDRLKNFLHGACRSGVPCVNVDSCRDDLRPVCQRGRCALVENGPEAHNARPAERAGRETS